MSTQDQARALMMRHHHRIKNRQQSMLGRAMVETGMPSEGADVWHAVQGKPFADAGNSYDRSQASLS